MDDRIVYQAICNLLIENSHEELKELANNSKVFANIPTEPKIQSPYVFKRVFSNRFSKSEGQYDRFKGEVLRSRKEFLEKHKNAWLVRTDVRSYFPSLDHNRLCKLLDCKNWLSDNRTKGVLLDCLKKWEVEHGKGIPIGYECSDHIGNLFLIPLDEALADFRVHRYVDDIYIYVEDYERAKQAIHIVDKVLENLSLQRNTLKTEFLNLRELSEKDLKERLTESLSQLADEKSTEKSKAQRQRDLLALLHSEFGAGFETLNLTGRIASISKVAFVLYRLRWADETVRRIAYLVLDHHPNYAYHAMTYLYHAYSRDPEFELKLVSIFEAEYEAQDTKANALRFLSLIDHGDASNSYIEELLANPEAKNWHLTYGPMRDANYSGLALEYSEQLINLAEHSNPFLSAYAATAACLTGTNETRLDLVQRSLHSQSTYTRKIGLYLALLFQIDIDPSPVPHNLEGLLSLERLGEKEDFHRSISELFYMELLRDFPIEKYFGNIKSVNQTFRDMKLHRAQGITQFIKASTDLLVTFFRRWDDANNPRHLSNGVQYPDDSDLKSLIRDLEGNSASRTRWNNGDLDYLSTKVRKSMRHYLKGGSNEGKYDCAR